MNKKLTLLFLPALLMGNTISFSEALNKTIANNKSLKAKKLSIEESKLDMKTAKGYNYGTLTFNENIARSNNALNVFGMKLMSREATFSDFGFNEFDTTNPNLLTTKPEDLNNPEARTNYETKLTYTLPIFTGFKLSTAKDMSELQVKANIAKYKFDEKEMGLEVLKAYNGAVAAKHFILATKKAKKATKSFVYFASEMLNEGYVTSLDVKQAKVYDMKINSQLLESQNKYSLAIAYLQFLTSDDAITDVKDFASIAITDETLISKNSYINRDDYKWMQNNTKTMQKKIDFEKSASYPMIGSHLEYGFNDDQLNNIDKDKDYYVAAIGIEYKIFDGFKTSSNIQKAKIQYAKTKYYLNYMKDGIKLQIKKASLTLQTKKSVLQEKLKAKNLADEVLVQSKEMYENQLIKMSDLLMQQAQTQKARAELIMAKYEKTIAAAKLKLALGYALN
ncbi:MAG TPA: TolC family protein [Arcobacter sp.]|nr:TolC family protein [Arcobacter sp.]HIP56234.1 TolC family protein [Arcobacter sp.]